MDKTLIKIITSILKEALKDYRVETITLTFALIEPNRAGVFRFGVRIGTLNIQEPTNESSWVVEYIPFK